MADNHAFIIVKRVKAVLVRLVSSNHFSSLLVLSAKGFTSPKALSTRRIAVLLNGRREGIERWSLDRLLARNQRSLDASSVFFFFGLFVLSLNSAHKHSLPLSLRLSDAPSLIVIYALYMFRLIRSGLFVLMEVDTAKLELIECCLFKLLKGAHLLNLRYLDFSISPYVKKGDLNSLTHCIKL
jgi:hypothetical protein